MAETATKQSTPSFVGTSKVVQTEYPVSDASLEGAIAVAN
jgi:hypothetical protein